MKFLVRWLLKFLRISFVKEKKERERGIRGADNSSSIRDRSQSQTFPPIGAEQFLCGFVVEALINF